MQILFIHQNIPGQFKHLIAHFSRMTGVKVWAIGEATRVRSNWPNQVDDVHLYGYVFNAHPVDAPARENVVEANIRRGLAVVKSLESLKENGLDPDIVFGHPGWGEMLFIRDVFPNTRIVNYCELYLSSEGQDLGFDPEFPERPSQRYAVRAQNMTQTQSLLAGDLGISPTHWQKSRYPALLQQNIQVAFDGVDCDLVKPNKDATFDVEQPQLKLSASDEVITFVNRNIEPLRGFHVFMRALPELQKMRPNAHIVIVGGDGRSYSRPLSNTTYRELYRKEIDGRVDWSKIHFVGWISYNRYLQLLQVSTVHVYLSYPFVLSWSLLEAMAIECAIVASNTAPIREVITDGKEGLLVDFFDQQALRDAVVNLCEDRVYAKELGKNARQRVQTDYDLKSICLPRQIEILLSE